jgi:two-component system response regulator YesN
MVAIPVTKHKLIFRFALPYILILIIPLLTGYLYYEKTLAVVEEQVTENNLSILEQSKTTLNSRLAEVDIFGQKLVSDPNVIKFQYAENPMSGSNMGVVLDMIKQLAGYKPINQFIFDYYILYKSSELALSNNTVYRLQEFYDTIQRQDRVEYEEWFMESLGAYYYHKFIPVRSVVFKGEQRSFVTYIRSLGYPSYFPGAAVVLIDEMKLKDSLRGLDVSDGGWAYIADANGNLMTQLSGQGVSIPVEASHPVIALPEDQSSGIFHLSMEGKEMLVTFTKSDYNNWTYVAVQPTHIILGKVHEIRELMLVLFAISLVLGGLFSFVLAYRGSKPVGGLIGTLMEHFGEELPKSKAGYPFLRTAVSHIINNNKELREKMGVQLPFLQAALLERMLRSSFVNEGDLTAAFAHAGLNISARYYAVAILQFCGYDNRISASILEELSIKRLLVREKLAGEFGDRIYLHETKEDQLILLLMFDQDNAVGCKTASSVKLNNVAGTIREEDKIETVISLGSFYEQRMDISRSYDEARQALYYLNQPFKSVVLAYEDISLPITQYFYSGETETRLVNLTKVGESGQVDKLFAKLEEENFVQRHLSLDMLRLFVYEVWGTLVKTSGELPQQESNEFAVMKEWIKRLESYEDCHFAFQQLRQEFIQICSKVNGNKKSHNVELLRSVLDAIHSSLSSESLTLFQIAGSLHVS